MIHASLGSITAPAVIAIVVLSMWRRLLFFAFVLLTVAAVIGLFEIITFLHR